MRFLSWSRSWRALILIWYYHFMLSMALPGSVWAWWRPYPSFAKALTGFISPTLVTNKQDALVAEKGAVASVILTWSKGSCQGDWGRIVAFTLAMLLENMSVVEWRLGRTGHVVMKTPKFYLNYCLHVTLRTCVSERRGSRNWNFGNVTPHSELEKSKFKFILSLKRHSD